MSDTPTPLPPPTGYDSWLDYAISCVNFRDLVNDHHCFVQTGDAQAASRAELDALISERESIQTANEHLEKEVDALRSELAALREALKGVVRHLGNGSAVSADSSTEFLCQVPNEVALCVGGLRRELARLKRIEVAAKGLLECLSESEKHYIEAEINALSDAIKKP